MDAPPLTLETQTPGWGADSVGHAETGIIRMEMHLLGSGPGSPRGRKLRLGGSPAPAAPTVSLSLFLKSAGRIKCSQQSQ